LCVFERFTDRARRVVVLAQEEARLLDHSHIGTEHVLLGLLHEREGVAARVLVSLGLDLGRTRDLVEELVGRGTSTPGGHIPFTPRSKKALELSLREALTLGHNYIGTEHLLLGLIREGDGVGCQALRAFGLELPVVRQAVVDTLGGLVDLGTVDLAGETAAGDVAVARDGMLRRMLADEDSYLTRALREHGVDPGEFGATLDRLAEEG
jgi:ATP-dependent Clp protease ATP-binding subunit ClpC